MSDSLSFEFVDVETAGGCLRVNLSASMANGYLDEAQDAAEAVAFVRSAIEGNRPLLVQRMTRTGDSEPLYSLIVGAPIAYIYGAY